MGGKVHLVTPCKPSTPQAQTDQLLTVTGATAALGQRGLPHRDTQCQEQWLGPQKALSSFLQQRPPLFWLLGLSEHLVPFPDPLPLEVQESQGFR